MKQNILTNEYSTPNIGEDIMTNASSDVIDDVINTKTYRNILHKRQNILTEFEYSTPNIGGNIMENTSDDVINDIIHTKI